MSPKNLNKTSFYTTIKELPYVESQKFPKDLLTRDYSDVWKEMIEQLEIAWKKEDDAGK